MTSDTKTYVRIRKSDKSGNTQTIFVGEDKKLIRLQIEKDPQHGLINNQTTAWEFTVDKVFENDSQKNVFREVSANLIPMALKGISGTLLCYGQTGAGKTFTMSGVSQRYPDRGIIPRSLAQLFEEIDKMPTYAVLVRLSYIEIYNEQIIDLFSPAANAAGSKQASQLVISDAEDEVTVKGLACPMVNNLEDALCVLFEGELNRTVAAHALNRISSRAHTIFTIYLDVRSIADTSGCVKSSRLNYVDLAGSERIRKTQSTGQILKEANYINRSLTFLEQTVLALSDPCREHIPYRQSKLTHYLKNSIGGRYQTILIANIWDEDRFIEETISTLRFASRVMRIPCQPTVKQKFDTMATIKQLQRDNALLKRELLMYDTLNNREKMNYENLTEQQKQQIRSQVVRYLDGEVTDLEVENLKQLRETFVSFKHLNHALRSQVDELRQQLSKGTVVSDIAQPTMTGGAVNVNSNTTAAVGVRMNTRVTNIKKQGNVEAEKPQSIPQVGELDPSGGFGVAVTDGIPPVTPALVQDSVVMQVKRKERRRSNVSPKGTRRSICQSPTQTTECSAKAKDPPTKMTAFEDFKGEAGRELFKIFADNKAMLTQKLEEGIRSANQVNQLKLQMDMLFEQMNQMKAEREAQGLIQTTEGEPIITEEEFELLKQIRVLKMQYNHCLEEWKKLKEVVNYCRHMVELSRAKLLQEYDNWYQGCFVDNDCKNMDGNYPDTPSIQSVDQSNRSQNNNSTDSDRMERFQVAQFATFERCPEGRAYERAKENTIYQHIFKEMPLPKNLKSGLPRGIPVE